MIIKIICVCIISLCTTLILRNVLPSYSPIISICTGVICTYFIIPNITAVIDTAEVFAREYDEIKSYILMAMKVVLISLLCEFAAQICSDNGQNYLASKIEFSGKITVLLLILPELLNLMNKITDLIAEL